jgi:eukaryotic-like serine/threonine-protein kinase
MPNSLSPVPPVGSAADSGPNAETDGYYPDQADADEINLRAFLAPPQGEGELGRLAHYRVLKELGRGGMGMVLLAEDSKLRRLAAIKIMLPRYARNPQACDRFLREARSAARIKHDNVITIFQVDEANGIPFIAMEFLKGAPLDRYLKDKGELSISQVVRIGHEIAEGLQAARAVGLIHRDIKPANIWLEAPKGRGKILDFGLAREERDDAHLTNSGAVVGTPAYMSPEQAYGKPLDPRSDLFSLGVILYRLCTGQPPFAGPNTMAVLTALAIDTPKPVRQLNPNVPAALEQLIERLLAKDRQQRPASAKEAAVALAKIAHPAGTGKAVVVKETVYVEVPTALIPDPFANIDAIPSAVEPAPPPARRINTDEAAPRSDRKPLLWGGLALGVIALALGGYLLLKDKKKPLQPAVDAVVDSGEKKNDKVVDAGEKKNDAKVVEPSRPPQDVVGVDADRKAVELLHPHIDGIWARMADGRRLQIKKSDAIPTEHFVVVKVQAYDKSYQLPPDFNLEVLLAAVRPLSSLQALALGADQTAVTEEQMSRLAAAPAAGSLHYLDGGFELTVGAIDLLKRFPQLTSLTCRAYKTEDAELALLKDLPLTRIYFAGLGKSGRVGQRGCQALAAMPLSFLYLNGPRRLDAAAIQGLVAMPGLRNLGVSNADNIDDLVPEIAKLPGLERLNLYNNSKLTDAGLTHLARLKTLRSLGLVDCTAVTAAAAKRLAEALPRCQIDLGKGVSLGPKIPAPALLHASFTQAQADQARAEWAKYEEVPARKQLDLGNGVKLDLVLVPPGQFRMGTEGNNKDEAPHQVTITRPFFMAVTETTQAQYEAVMGKNPSVFSAKGVKKEKIAPGADTASFPVDSVPWFDAMAFSKKVGANLPTEGQWEYACRAGTTTAFYFGDSLAGADANIADTGLARTTRVASYLPNAFGLYDMHGNVREWCRDWYADKTDDLGEKDRERTIKQSEDRRVLRGGSWAANASQSRAASRHNAVPGNRGSSVGFRVVVGLP